MKFCTKCGAIIEDDAKFCNKCGNKIIPDEKVIDDTLIDIQGIKIDENNSSKEESEYKEKELKSHNKIWIKIVSGIILLIVVSCGVFFNKIIGTYYIMKCKNSYIDQEKLNYATKAVTTLENDESKELLKDILINMSKNNLSEAEIKLNEISSLLTESDYRNISVKIKEKKIDELSRSSQYEEVFSEFIELDKLGEDFRKNQHYDEVMLNVIAKLTGTSLKSNKNDLMEDNCITYDDFDGDNYDEIIQSKESTSRNGRDVKVILYKVEDGKYKQADVNTLDNCANSEVQGVYQYADKCNGVFIGYTNYIGDVGATSVYSVKNGKLSNKGTVAGKNITRPEDINNDGIYEIKSTSISYATSRAKETTKWYMIHDDGSMPTELNNTSDSSDLEDYIFPDSNKAYLADEQLKGLNKDELALARNEIFARHGYSFKEEPFKSYFLQKKWYTSNPSYDGSDSTLNEYEIANYKAIQYWENR